MLNVLRPALSRVLTPIAELLARTPITPNAITIIGTAGVAAGALWLFPIGHLFARASPQPGSARGTERAAARSAWPSDLRAYPVNPLPAARRQRSTGHTLLAVPAAGRFWPGACGRMASG